MTKKVLITSALLYANGQLHFGHIAGAFLPADCYARFERLMGSEVLFISGSDEYGVAITISAEAASVSPKEHVDKYHTINLDFFHKLHFSFDHFSRTTNPYHEEAVKQFFLDLVKNGHIEERVTEQLYSNKEKRFLADRYVLGTCPKCGYNKARGDECGECGASYDATDLLDPVSKLTKDPLERRKTNHWFLLLDHFKERLKEWVDTKKLKGNVSKFIKGYIDELRPRSITRDSSWGIPVPLEGAEGKVLYVWFDAPIGYISQTIEWAHLQNKKDAWKSFWLDPETKYVQFLGKDNIPFHAAIFPAMVMGQDQPFKLVDDLPANEFYKLEGRQFSKSDGWTIDLNSFFTRYTSDQIRYAIAKTAPENQDTNFCWKEFQQACNADLVGKFGNLANRTLTFTKSKLESMALPIQFVDEEDKEFYQKMLTLLEQIKKSYQTYSLRQASAQIMQLCSLGNSFFEKKAPWSDAKIPEKIDRMKATVSLCQCCLKFLALASYPIMPKSAETLYGMLGFEGSLEKITWGDLINLEPKDGQKISCDKILFQKVEDEQIESELDALKKSLAAP